MQSLLKVTAVSLYCLHGSESVCQRHNTDVWAPTPGPRRRAPYLFDGLTTCDQRLKKPSPRIPLRRMLQKYVFPPHSFLCVFFLALYASRRLANIYFGLSIIRTVAVAYWEQLLKDRQLRRIHNLQAKSTWLLTELC